METILTAAAYLLGGLLLLSYVIVSGLALLIIVSVALDIRKTIKIKRARRGG